jgi:hypothetical protein
LAVGRLAHDDAGLAGSVGEAAEMSGLEAPARHYVVHTLQAYWPRGAHPILSLPLSSYADLVQASAVAAPALATIDLPEWARDVGVDGALVVPQVCTRSGDWHDVDWLAAAFWYLSGSAERAWEAERGPIHSYSYRLAGWPAQMWERAWVNRIALLLRRWAARNANADESEALGPLPRPRIELTHDVDAVAKTGAIRLKQGAFRAFNTVRALAAGNAANALRLARDAARVALGPGNYWQLQCVADLEATLGIRSHFLVHGGGGGWRRGIRAMMLDPAYDVLDPRVAAQLKKLAAAGFSIGVHPSFDAWHDHGRMRSQKERVEEAVGGRVTACRQHWLRFSWERTWAAQEQAGLELDFTLAFNDRCAFRNAAALEFHPWDHARHRPMRLRAIPTILMDSHLYDYDPGLEEAGQARKMQRWLDEVRAVRGTASVIWHPHTLAPDYGWADGFRTLLGVIASRYAL